jgi:hypothetical protein
MQVSSRVAVVVVAAMISACTKSQPVEHEVSASAVAYATKDGSVKAKEATDAEIAAASSSHQELENLNKRYPLRDPPIDSEMHKVTGFLAPATFLLEDGKRVQIDGVACSEKGVSVISTAWIDENTHIAFFPASSIDASTVAAEVWIIDTDATEQGRDTSYQPAGHNFIGTGHCLPVFSQTNKLNERYKMFAAMVARDRPELLDDAR